MEKQKGTILILLPILIVIGLIAGYFYFSDGGIKTPIFQNIPLIAPKPTPFPFQEMTIPYLRKQDFESELGELDLVSQNSEFTTYLTNYGSDGLEINGLLLIPSGPEPIGGWPAVVFVHGYIPPEKYETLKNYTPYVEALAREGLVVFKIDLRGHDDSEGEPGGAYFSSEYITDTLNAYAALQSTDFVNSKKIGLWGHSMAGNVVFRGFVAKTDIPKVVIWAGAVYTYEDFGEYGLSDNSYRPAPQDSERRRKRQELFDTYGAEYGESEFWQQVAPTNYLEGVNGEVQIHHAVNDSVVNIGYSRNLLDILEGAGIEGELFEYSSGGHNLVDPSFTTAMKRSADFFKE